MQEHPVQAVVEFEDFDFLETFLNSVRGEPELLEDSKESCNLRNHLFDGFVNWLRDLGRGVLKCEFDDSSLLFERRIGSANLPVFGREEGELTRSCSVQAYRENAFD